MMNNKTVLFKEVDRIIRIVYKELSFNNHILHSCLYKEINSNQIADSFDLNNVNVRTRIKKEYLLLYPNNYNADDLDFILNMITQQLLKKYNSSDTFYLIFLVSDLIINKGFDGIYIDFDDLLEWDGFINKIENKLFIAAYQTINGINEDDLIFAQTVNHNNKRLYDIFRRIGLSENHMHLKASGYINDINWRSFIEHSLFEKNDYIQFVEKSGIFSAQPKSKENVQELVEYILKFKVIRLSLEAIVKKDIPIDESKIIGFVIDVLQSDDVLQTVVNANHKFDIESITEALSDKRPNLDDELGVIKYAYFELEFLREMMILLIANNTTQYTKVLLFFFNLYICGMTDLKFQFLQDNLGMGFAKFKEKEDNKSLFIKKKNKDDVIRSAFHKYYTERFIKKIEFRIGPEDNPQKYISEIEKMNQMNVEECNMAIRNCVKQGIEPPSQIQFGLIIHFIKTLKSSNESIIQNEDSKRVKLEHETNILIETLLLINQIDSDSNYSLKNKIVGIDTANYEFDNRPTLYSQYFRKMRLNEDGKRLFFTYHVGEEFPTLSNGLRAIDEVLTFCDYRANDRLGHALALGINVTDYYDIKRNKIMSSIGDFLDDLVWMYSLLIEHDPIKYENYLLFLKQEYSKYAHILFDQSEIPAFDDYFDFYFLKGDCPDIYLNYQEYMTYQEVCQRYAHKLNFSNIWHKSAFMNKRARNLFIKYSFSEPFREKYDQSLGIVVKESFIKCLEIVQNIIRKKVLRMRIFVESNPTSNKKISYIDQYIKLPSLNLNRHHLQSIDDNLKINIPISINTDDSSIFQTNLTNEYSFVAAALIREGYDEESVYDYIEDLAIASNSHSFIKI